MPWAKSSGPCILIDGLTRPWISAQAACRTLCRESSRLRSRVNKRRLLKACWSIFFTSFGLESVSQHHVRPVILCAWLINNLVLRHQQTFGFQALLWCLEVVSVWLISSSSVWRSLRFPPILCGRLIDLLINHAHRTTYTTTPRHQLSGGGIGGSETLENIILLRTNSNSTRFMTWMSWFNASSRNALPTIVFRLEKWFPRHPKSWFPMPRRSIKVVIYWSPRHHLGGLGVVV